MRLISLQEHALADFQLDHVQDETTQHADIIRELAVELFHQLYQSLLGLCRTLCRRGGITGKKGLKRRFDGFLGRSHEDLEHPPQGFFLLRGRLFYLPTPRALLGQLRQLFIHLAFLPAGSGQG